VSCKLIGRVIAPQNVSELAGVVGPPSVRVIPFLLHTLLGGKVTNGQITLIFAEFGLGSGSG
jgi:hypothetical protein